WERPLGVVVQLGGQTPLQLTKPLEAAGVRVLGTAPDAIDMAEDRERFEALARRLGITQPPNGIARSVAEAVAVAQRIGYPVLVRPSYVLGGRAMEIVYDDGSLRDYFERAARARPRACSRATRRACAPPTSSGIRRWRRCGATPRRSPRRSAWWG